MAIKKHIPNAITCLNLLSGCVAAIFAFQGDLIVAAWLVYLASLFDFLDGFAARGLKAYSAIGKELDSLADMVSFGFVPALVVYQLIEQSLSVDFPFANYLSFTAFFLAVFSALRLAIFNLDDRQTSSFIGLPTPANGLFWVSIAAWLQFKDLLSLLHPGVLLVLVLFFSYLLVSSLPMYSLKIKSLSLKANSLPLILVISSILMVIAFGFLGVSLAIAFYIVSSFVVKIYNR
ncbi:MAG: CDP-diacylglycerol--serine O-phosphatidyltransferase [Bacteroidales bacterium]